MEDLLTKIQNALDDIEYIQFCLEEREIWDDADRLRRAVEKISSCLDMIEEHLDIEGDE